MAAARIFSLKGVPDDEAEDVRRLLTEHGIVHYETPVGMWGLTGGAIWTKDAAQAGKARALIDSYQQARAKSMRAAYAQLKAQGETPTFVDRLMEDPLRFIVYAAVAAGVLYLSIKPFIHFGK